MRFLLKSNSCRSFAKKSTKISTKTRKSTKGSIIGMNSSCDSDVITDDNLTKSWGQQCSPTCGCVLRFETKTDERQRIVECNYVAKSVVTTVDDKNGGRLTPIYTTRKKRPMLQECKCKSLHALAKHVTSYLPNNSWNHVQCMNDFNFIRSSIAFRHTVLRENGLPRTDTHCFDVVEEAFTGLLNGHIPSKRRINEPLGMLLAADYVRQLPGMYLRMTKRNDEDLLHASLQHVERIENGSDQQGIGADSNHVLMSTPKTLSTLGIFGIDGESWLDEETCDKGAATIDSRSNEWDWVSYVDEQHMGNDLA